MKQEVLLSVLPSVQSFLEIDSEYNESQLVSYCDEFRQAIATLAVVKNQTNSDHDVSVQLDNVISFCAFLYNDLERIRKDVAEYYKA